MNDITIISSNKNWMESTAIDQLNKVAKLDGMAKVIGLPDLHPGKTPIGAVFITESIVYPHLIGNDIGCGMSLFMTDVEKRKFKLERITKKLQDLNDLRHIDISDLIRDINDGSLGTIGGGNHFAEFQSVEKVYDLEEFDKIGFDENKIMLLVHSGSRGHGERILNHFIKEHHAEKGLYADSEEGKLYISQHNEALKWAVRNRKMIALRLLKATGISIEAAKMLDNVHNCVSLKQTGSKVQCIHRKGAVVADRGMVVIPGSRGSLTYIVKPSADTSVSGYSLAHGAGRKWERGMCKGRLEGIYNKETIKQTRLKGKVICKDANLLFEEASEAYKNIDIVIQSLVDFGLIKVIATLKPILTVKA
jgi:release factor H-coupled RctB family protein